MSLLTQMFFQSGKANCSFEQMVLFIEHVVSKIKTMQSELARLNKKDPRVAVAHIVGSLDEYITQLNIFSAKLKAADMTGPASSNLLAASLLQLEQQLDAGYTKIQAFEAESGRRYDYHLNYCLMKACQDPYGVTRQMPTQVLEAKCAMAKLVINVFQKQLKEELRGDVTEFDEREFQATLNAVAVTAAKRMRPAPIRTPTEPAAAKLNELPTVLSLSASAALAEKGEKSPTPYASPIYVPDAEPDQDDEDDPFGMGVASATEGTKKPDPYNRLGIGERMKSPVRAPSHLTAERPASALKKNGPKAAGSNFVPRRVSIDPVVLVAGLENRASAATEGPEAPGYLVSVEQERQNIRGEHFRKEGKSVHLNAADGTELLDPSKNPKLKRSAGAAIVAREKTPYHAPVLRLPAAATSTLKPAPVASTLVSAPTEKTSSPAAVPETPKAAVSSPVVTPQAPSSKPQKESVLKKRRTSGLNGAGAAAVATPGVDASRSLAPKLTPEALEKHQKDLQKKKKRAEKKRLREMCKQTGKKQGLPKAKDKTFVPRKKHRRASSPDDSGSGASGSPSASPVRKSPSSSPKISKADRRLAALFDRSIHDAPGIPGDRARAGSNLSELAPSKHAFRKTIEKYAGKTRTEVRGKEKYVVCDTKPENKRFTKHYADLKKICAQLEASRESIGESHFEAGRIAADNLPLTNFACLMDSTTVKPIALLRKLLAKGRKADATIEAVLDACEQLHKAITDMVGTPKRDKRRGEYEDQINHVWESALRALYLGDEADGHRGLFGAIGDISLHFATLLGGAQDYREDFERLSEERISLMAVYDDLNLLANNAIEKVDSALIIFPAAVGADDRHLFEQHKFNVRAQLAFFAHGLAEFTMMHMERAGLAEGRRLTGRDFTPERQRTLAQSTQKSAAHLRLNAISVISSAIHDMDTKTDSLDLLQSFGPDGWQSFIEILEMADSEVSEPFDTLARVDAGEEASISALGLATFKRSLLGKEGEFGFSDLFSKYIYSLLSKCHGHIELGEKHRSRDADIVTDDAYAPYLRTMRDVDVCMVPRTDLINVICRLLKLTFKHAQFIPQFNKITGRLAKSSRVSVAISNLMVLLDRLAQGLNGSTVAKMSPKEREDYTGAKGVYADLVGILMKDAEKGSKSLIDWSNAPLKPEDFTELTEHAQLNAFEVVEVAEVVAKPAMPPAPPIPPDSSSDDDDEEDFDGEESSSDEEAPTHAKSPSSTGLPALAFTPAALTDATEPVDLMMQMAMG